MGEEEQQPTPDVEVGSVAETRMLQERFKDGNKECGETLIKLIYLTMLQVTCVQ